MIKLFFKLIIVIISFYSTANAQEAYKTSPKIFQEKISSLKNKALLIDVRTPHEFKKEHLKNAVNIDFFNKNFKDQLSKLDTNKPILVYCASGNRSGKTTSVLKSLGFKTIFDLDGGIKKWKKEGLPTNL